MAKTCVKCAGSTAGEPVVHEECYDEECAAWQEEYELLETRIAKFEQDGFLLDPFDRILDALRRERLPHYA